MDFGFFLTSLKTFAKINLVSLGQFLSNNINYNYQHVIIDAKIRIDYSENDFLPLLKAKIKTPVSLFLAYDRPFNFYDVIGFENFLNIKYYFIPNLLLDLKKYNLPVNLENKIILTYYGLGFLDITYDDLNNSFLIDNNKKREMNSIFFSGTVNKNREYRFQIIEYLEKIEFNNKKIISYDANDSEKIKLSQTEYINESISSKINIVLCGNQNNISYRLFEMAVLNTFFLVDHYFLNYYISSQFKNVGDFTFKNIEELDFKINTLLKDNLFYESIKSEQANIFKKLYCPKTHGKYIKGLIDISL